MGLLLFVFIKIVSCIIGYSLWAFIAQYQTTTMQYSIPICFYQTNEEQIITGPEFVTCLLEGKRKNLYSFNAENSIIHIDASLYKEGTYAIPLSKEDLFLPNNLQLLTFKPATIKVTIGNKNHESST